MILRIKKVKGNMQITRKIPQTFQDFKAEVKKPTVLEDDVGFFLSFSLET